MCYIPRFYSLRELYEADMEAGEHGLTRVTCFFARRLEVVAVARLLCIYLVVCFGCGWISLGGVLISFHSNARGLLQV